jgi:SPP1 family phage portal protein
MTQIQFEETIPADTLKELISEWSTKRWERNERYYTGNNPTIVERKVQDANAPDNKIPISYARKIINTVVGYMYKPGLITYASENEPYFDALTEIFDENNEPLKTAHLAKEVSIQGQGYEIHYVDNDGARIIPRFAKVPTATGLPIYNFDLEPKLKAFLYLIKKGEDEELSVYYADHIEYYRVERQKGGLFNTRTNRRESKVELISIGEDTHPYGDVPVVVAYNNRDELGDFEPVIKLIDAYDILMSDSMNEFDRFAWAYLVLRGMTMDDEVVQKIKHMRTFELMTDEGGVEFLTKDINAEFIRFMSEWVREEIHKQSHVPNFLDGNTGDQLSGVAISKLLYDFEFIAATKQALFEEALQRRVKLLNNLFDANPGNFTGIGDDRNVKINFARNKPDEILQFADLMQKFAGFVSQRTLLENFAPFVPDVDAELDRLEEEKPEFDIDQGFGQEPDGQAPSS